MLTKGALSDIFDTISDRRSFYASSISMIVSSGTLIVRYP